MIHLSTGYYPLRLTVMGHVGMNGHFLPKFDQTARGEHVNIIRIDLFGLSGAMIIMRCITGVTFVWPWIGTFPVWTVTPLVTVQSFIKDTLAFPADLKFKPSIP
jgi:hypothetical protein